MDIKRVALTVMLAALTACAGQRRTAKVEPLAPAIATTLDSTIEKGFSSAGPETASAAAERLAVFEPLRLEPLGCPIYAGDDRPDYDSQGLDCLVKWMREAQSYLAHGGKPTKHTNPARYEENRALARKLEGRLAGWLRSARLDAAASPAPAPKAVPRSSTLDGQASQQSYLEGMIHFQKGAYEKAREAWRLAVKLDASNTDAKAGLAKLDELYSAP